MKPLLLLFFVLLCFYAGAQNLSWLHGDWMGETYFPNGPITTRIIVRLHVVKITGSHFEATLDNFYPNDTTVRLERAITGRIVNKKFLIESSRQTYILDPRTQSFWRDCSDCDMQSAFHLGSDKVELKIQTINCGNECNGETSFSRDTSNMDKMQQNDLAKWFHLPQKPLANVKKTKAQDSTAMVLKTNPAKTKTDTLLLKTSVTKDATYTARKKLPVMDSIISGQPSKHDSSASKKTGNLVSSSSKIPDHPVASKGKEKDAAPAKAIEVSPIKKESLSNPAVPKIDSVPVALTTRTTNLVTTFHVSSPHIVIQLFDNAEIDGDIVTVYHNGQLIVNRQSLTHKAITFTIDASKADAHHEFIMVADNLGLIPPNTALMRITAGEQKFELEVSSDFDNNSKIAIDYTGE